MLELFVIETALLVMGLLSSYLTWIPFSSVEMIILFGPRKIDITPKIRGELEKDRKRLRAIQMAGFRAEMLRAILLYLFSLLALSFFEPDKNLRFALSHPLLKQVVLVGVFLSFIWCLFVGPKLFAEKDGDRLNFLSQEHYSKYIFPYWTWVLYPISIFVGFGVLAFTLTFINISVDLSSFDKYIFVISSILYSTIEDIQLGTIHLIQFGYWISSTSQKYILVSLLIFVYVILEQRSSLHQTILESSIERLKFGVWIILILSIGYSLVFLPLKYEELHARLLMEINYMVQGVVPSEHINDVLSTQQFLQDHDLQWLLINSLTGYGNLVSYILIGAIIVVWRLYFDKTPLKLIFKLFVPSIIIKWGKMFFTGFHFEGINNSDD